MISINRGQAPAVLVAHGAAWCTEFVAAVAAGAQRPSRYRHDEIREALRADTHGKCAYCESQIEHISFSHIEHILPKAAQPHLVCAWENLTLACEKCNQYKGDYYSVVAPLLNPYVDDVSGSITFFGPMAVHLNDRGMLSISTLRLNRSPLLFRRMEVLVSIERILDLLRSEHANDAVRVAMTQELQDRLQASAEYSSCSNCFESDRRAQRQRANAAAEIEAEQLAEAE